MALSSRFSDLCRVLDSDVLNNDSAKKGYCTLCSSVVGFINNKASDASGWVDLRGQFQCASCLLNARQRLLVKILFADLDADAQIHVFEAQTPLTQRLSRMFSNITESEYFGPAVKKYSRKLWRGQLVQHEDLCDTTFKDSELDAVCHADVLEHIPDYRSALSESFRILRRGGRLVFAAPVYNFEATIQTAKLDSQGNTEFLGKPMYHGDPHNPKTGVPVYYLFGADLMDSLLLAGFRKVEACIDYSPIEGFYTNGNPYDVGRMAPIVFVAVK